MAKIVSTRAGDLLGGDVRVVFRATDGSSPLQQVGVAPSDEPESSERVDRDDLAEAPPDVTDPLSLVEAELGGMVVEEYEEGDGR